MAASRYSHRATSGRILHIFADSQASGADGPCRIAPLLATVCGMIEIIRSPEPGITVIRLSGAVSGPTLASLPDTAEFAGINGRILSDWLGLEEYSLAEWSAEMLFSWTNAARRFERISLLHHATWNRQAALLAALMRKENVPVRSWRPAEAAAAKVWLERESNSVQLDFQHPRSP